MKQLKFISYNIRVDHEQDKSTENEWSNRKDKTIQTIKRHNADIIALQEPNVKQVEDIKNAFEANFTWICAKASDKAYEDYNLFKSEQHRETQTIGFNNNLFRLINHGRFWLAEDPVSEPTSPAYDGSIFSRVAVYVSLLEISTGKRLCVITSHFDHVGLQARINSAKLLVKKAVELSKNEFAFIISGDFNTFQNDNGPLVYDAFKSQFDLITDVRDATANITGPESTWVGWEYNNFNEKQMELNMPGIPSRWDHIFISKYNIKVSSTEVCDDKYEIEWNGGTKTEYPSGHRPMIMDFELI